MTTTLKSPYSYLWIFLTALILCFGFILRWQYLHWGLPYLLHADESVNLRLMHNMIGRNSLNPRWFRYPSMMFYVNLPGQLFVKYSHHGLLDFSTPIMGSGYTAQPSALFAARLTSLIFGTGLMAISIFWLTLVTEVSWAYVLAALLLAFNPLLVRHSEFFAPDVITSFFTAVSLVGTTLIIVKRGEYWTYVFTGCCVGLAAAAKYNAGAVFAGFAMAHWIVSEGKPFRRDRKFYALFLFPALGFLVGCPGSVLTPMLFVRGAGSEILHYAHGHAGAEGGSLAFYGHLAIQAFGLLLLLLVFTVVPKVFRTLAPTVFFSVFYFGLIAVQRVHFARNFIPLIAPASVLIAAGACRATQYLSGRWRGFATPLFACLCVASLLPTAKLTYAEYRDYREDWEDKARLWAESAIPSDATVAIESYDPFLDQKQRTVDGQPMLAKSDVAWTEHHGYAVLSREMSGRFTQKQYPTEYATLQTLRAAACSVGEFHDAQASPRFTILRFHCQ